MFVRKLRIKGQKEPYYMVLHSYREGHKVKHQYIGSLGHYPTVERAYQAALKDSLRASDKLERLEYAMSSMQEKRA